MVTRKAKWLLSLAAMVGVFAGTSAFAAPTVQLKGDTGTLEVTTFSPLQEASASFNGIYGTPPFPTITPVTNGWKITFTPSSAFFASANNHAFGEKTILSGELQFNITFFQPDNVTPSPIHLTTNIFENGIYATSGNGTVAVNSADLPSGVTVTELDDSLATSTGNSFNGHASTSFSANGTWSLFDQVPTMAGAYSSYHVVIDNDLLAEALAGPSSSASIAKKNFSIIFTTDGSTGGGTPPTPEPASLGILAIGAMGLLARRRK